MSKKVPVNGFKLVEKTSCFSEGFIESYNEESNEGCFLEVDVQYLKKLNDLHNDLPFLPEKMKLKKLKNLLSIYVIKINMLFT